MLSNKLKISILIILLIIGGVAFYKYKQKTALANAAKQQQVVNDTIILDKTDVVNPAVKDVDDSIVFTGDLTSRDQSVISSEVSAKVLKVLVNEGDFVKRNQVLALLDNSELQQSVLQQKALLTSVKVNLALNKKKLDQQKELFNEGFISKIAYDELKSNYEDSLAKVNQQQAALLNSRKKLSDSVIRAPYDGYIYLKEIDQGQYVTINDKLLGIASLDVLQIQAAITSSQINLVSPHQVVHFVVENANTIYSGNISRINPVAQAGTRSYMVYIDFDNRKAKLKSGQFVKGEIIIKSIKDAVSIPTDVIRYSAANNGEPFVFAIDTNNKIIKQPIKIILNDKLHNISAVTGVKISDRLVINNVDNIKIGDKVSVGL